MIKSIHIKNFQSHEDTFLEFHDGVNSLVGSSDCGKTAIIRAMRWVLFNKPGGDAFRSHWGGDTSVVLTLDSGDVVGRAKGKENLYILNGKELAGFNQDVPEEVQRVLNVNQINFSSQLDAPFMIGDSSGEVAQKLNEAAQLDIIDKSASVLRKKLSKASSDLKYNSESLEQQEARLKEFEFIPHLESDVQKLEQTCHSLSSKKQMAEVLGSLVRQGRAKQETVNGLKAVIPPTSAVEQLEQSFALIEEKKGAQSGLDTLLDNIDDANEVVRVCAMPEGAEKALGIAEKAIEQGKEKLRTKNELSRLVHGLSVIRGDILSHANAMESLQHDFDEAFPDTCPLCGD